MGSSQSKNDPSDAQPNSLMVMDNGKWIAFDQIFWSPLSLHPFSFVGLSTYDLRAVISKHSNAQNN